MNSNVLLDTGPLVSLLDKRQPRHRLCHQTFLSLQRPLITVESVISEAAHLLDELPDGEAACLEFVLDTDIAVIPSDRALLNRVAKLLRKYSDAPMAFADAMLVALAEETGIHEIFTLDKHFHIYRIGRKAFTVIPDLPT